MKVDIVQGDVFLIPEGLVSKEEFQRAFSKGKRVSPSGRGLVLAEGEATGHAHRIADHSSATLYEYENSLYLDVKEDKTEVTHEEHGKVIVNRGQYKVGGIIEYDIFEEEARKVRD